MTRSTCRRTLAWSAFILILIPFLGNVGSNLAAQDGPDRFRARARVMARAYDNFFRRSSSGQQETVVAWTTQARATFRASVAPVIAIYGEGDYTRYGDVGESPGAGGGLNFWSRTHVGWIEAHYLQERPVFNVGDLTRFANLFRISGHYSFRPGDAWRFDLDGRTVQVQFDELPQADSRVYLGGGSIRYRAFSYLQPELGGRIGMRDAEDPDQDNTRGQVSLGVVTAPADPFWVNVRYRFRSRSYTSDDVNAGNFGRSDEGGQWTVVSALRPASYLQFHLIYNRMDMSSTLESRIYQSQSLALAVTLLL